MDKHLGIFLSLTDLGMGEGVQYLARKPDIPCSLVASIAISNFAPVCTAVGVHAAGALTLSDSLPPFSLLQ